MSIVFRPPEQRREEEVAELLNRSLTLDESPANVAVEEYAVIQLGNGPILPPRPPAPRGPPLTVEQWTRFQDKDGRILEVETLKDIIFRGVSYSYGALYEVVLNSPILNTVTEISDPVYIFTFLVIIILAIKS